MVEKKAIREIKIEEWFRDRWKRLGDMKEFLKVADPKYRNPDIYLEELIIKEEFEIADKRLITLEKVKLNNGTLKRQVDIERVRLKVQDILRNTDYTQLPDIPLTYQIKQEYRNYRQYLRDYPNKLVTGETRDYNIPTFYEWFYEDVKRNSRK